MVWILGAEDRARTGHPDLGKVVLYQMSYFRMLKNLLPAPYSQLQTLEKDGKDKNPSIPAKFYEVYLYFGVYNVLAGTSTSGFPLYRCLYKL